MSTSWGTLTAWIWVLAPVNADATISAPVSRGLTASWSCAVIASIALDAGAAHTGALMYGMHVVCSVYVPSFDEYPSTTTVYVPGPSTSTIRDWTLHESSTLASSVLEASR